MNQAYYMRIVIYLSYLIQKHLHMDSDCKSDGRNARRCMMQNCMIPEYSVLYLSRTVNVGSCLCIHKDSDCTYAFNMAVNMYHEIQGDKSPICQIMRAIQTINSICW